MLIPSTLIKRKHLTKLNMLSFLKDWDFMAYHLTSLSGSLISSKIDPTFSWFMAGPYLLQQ